MDFQVIFHKEAEVEYSESFVWYELRSDGLGLRFRVAVNATIEKIKLNLEIFARKREGFVFPSFYALEYKKNTAIVTFDHPIYSNGFIAHCLKSEQQIHYHVIYNCC